MLFFCTDLVVRLLGSRNTDNQEEISNRLDQEEVFKRLEEGLADIKSIANNFKQHIRTDKS